MVVTTLSTKVFRQLRFRVSVIPRGRPANRALETQGLILNGAGLRGSRGDAKRRR